MFEFLVYAGLAFMGLYVLLMIIGGIFTIIRWMFWGGD